MITDGVIIIIIIGYELTFHNCHLNHFQLWAFPLWEELLADNGHKEWTRENEPKQKNIFEVLEQYSLIILINSV